MTKNKHVNQKFYNQAHNKNHVEVWEKWQSSNKSERS